MRDLARTIGPVHREAERQRLARKVQDAKELLTEASQHAAICGEHTAGVYVMRAIAEAGRAARELADEDRA